MNKYAEAYDFIFDATNGGEGMIKELNVIRELICLAIPKKPLLTRENKNNQRNFNVIEFTCPTCHKITRTNFERNYCGECGQRLDWSKE